MGKLAKKVKPNAVKSYEDLLNRAREAHLQMHKSWFEFAEALYFLKVCELPINQDFKKTLEENFPDVDYKYSLKMCAVVEKYGSEIRSRLETTTKVPSINSLLLLSAVEKSDSREFERLKVELFESNLTVKALKARIDDLEKKTTAKEMVKDIRTAKEESEIVDIDVEDDEEETDEEIIEENLWGAVSAIHTRVKTLNENIPALHDLIIAHGKKDSRLTNLYNDCVDLFNEGLNNLMSAIDNLGGRK